MDFLQDKDLLSVGDRHLRPRLYGTAARREIQRTEIAPVTRHYVGQEGVDTECRVCELVWEAWKGEIPEGFRISHIDGNKQNNRLDNLELVKQP